MGVFCVLRITQSCQIYSIRIYIMYAYMYVHVWYIYQHIVYRFSAAFIYYGGTLLTTSLFQHDEHCGEYEVSKLYIHTSLNKCPYIYCMTQEEILIELVNFQKFNCIIRLIQFVIIRFLTTIIFPLTIQYFPSDQAFNSL